MTASWWHNFSIENATEYNYDAMRRQIWTYLFRDDNENGEFESGVVSSLEKTSTRV